MCQRLSQLIYACASGDAGRPNYKGVKHFTSEVSTTNVVPVSLRSYAHCRAKEEHDIDSLRYKAGGGAGAAFGGAADDGDEDDGPALGRKGRKANAKAKGGG